jgi:hypothetical protein
VREFLELCLTPPAWIFTFMMIPVSLYWLFSLFGSVLDHWGHAGHAADGLHGHGDVGHGDLHHAGDGHGHADGHGHDPAHGHGDGNLAHGEAYVSTWGGLSFGEVPKVLSLSLLVFIGWSASLLGLWLYPPLADLTRSALWIGAVTSAVAFALAFGATALAVRPINKLLVAGAGPRRSDLVGKLCTVRTQRVDDGFGQAEVDHASSLVQVRELFGRSFKYGQRALIYDYDEEREVFLIAPFDPVSGKIDIPGRQALPQAPVAATDDASESLPASRRGVKE